MEPGMPIFETERTYQDIIDDIEELQDELEKLIHKTEDEKEEDTIDSAIDWLGLAIDELEELIPDEQPK